MKKTIIFSVLMLFLFFNACRTTKNIQHTETAFINQKEEQFINSILAYGLDHEALYTILGKVKPMSSLVDYGFPIANSDSTLKSSADILNRNEHGAYLDSIGFMMRALNKLNIPDLKFVFFPYRASYDDTRILQVNVIRVSVLDSLLRAKESFFGQFGLAPGTDPAIVVSTIENADSYERFRGYGYLFGYPDYAVDFFVQASVSNDSTGKFVERNFFQIPTHTRQDGYFVYAYPKNSTPTAEVDSALYYRAEKVLKQYRDIRDNYLSSDSTLQAFRLISDFYLLPKKRSRNNPLFSE